MKEIQLTQGQVALVDDEDFDYLSQWKWAASWNKDTESFYAVRTSYEGRKHKVWMHRVLINVLDGIYVDHINHISLDNRKKNLRECTRSQNQQNRRKNRNNTSGYRGVFRHGKSWRASVRLNGKSVYRENFPTKEEAARAYDREAVKYYGKFANTNFEVPN